MAELRSTKVDLTGLMRVLGEALYSTPHVALRELVQNGHDSIERRRLQDPSHGGRIDVRVLANEGAVEIADNGAGLTEAEVHDYLATVGRGLTREVRDRGEGENLIGYFGMGFLSAFAVADSVTVTTQSTKAGSPCLRFFSRKGDTYSLEPHAGELAPGSVVRLKIKSDFTELLDPNVIRSLLLKYCACLPLAIWFDGEQLNAEPPPFRLPLGTPVARFRRQALEFVTRFEPDSEPLAVLHGDFDASSSTRAVFWLRGGMSFATSDLRQVAVYVRGMLIGDTQRELLPPWAGFVGMALEDDSLSPTASRETLKEDNEFRRVQGEVRQALCAGLVRLAEQDKPTWRRLLRRHNEALLGAALSDQSLFDLLHDQLTVPTSDGDLSLPEIVRRSKGRIHVLGSERSGFEELLFRARHVPLVLGYRFGAAGLCHRYAQSRGLKVVQMGTRGGDSDLFKPANPDPAQREVLERLFEKPNQAVVFSTFEPTHLPFVLVRDRDAEVKAMIESDEADRRMGAGVLALARALTKQVEERPLATLHLNCSSPVIQALAGASGEGRRICAELLVPLVDLLSDGVGGSAIDAAFVRLNGALGQILELGNE